MKKVLLVVSVAVMAILASCTKENLNNNVPSQEGFNVSILGEMGEFAATKSTAESCIRLKWENNDVVYAYGSNGSSIVALGSLTVAVESGNAYVALMSGTLTAAPNDGKLYLVHCPLLTAAPEISEGAVSISLASQPSTCVPFVAYATVTGVSAAAQSNLKASFSFASSVIKANVYGITNSTTMLSATLSDVNTACKITFGETIAVAGETTGSISKTLGTSSSASGKADFYIAVPAIAAASGRTLTVKTDNAWFAKTGAVTKAHEENAYVNTICDMTDATYAYETFGNGICIKGIIWAPVNCGYDATHTYGLCYQWGRKYGQAYEDGNITPVTSLTMADGQLEANKEKVGYIASNWFSGTVDNTLWNGASKGLYDPCPEGWRVPTYSEFAALINFTGSARDGDFTNTIVNVGGVDQRGSYFDGTGSVSATSGVFIPASGYRDNTTGVVYCRNEEYYGGYWCSSVNGNDAYIMTIYSGDEGLNIYSDSRAYGFSVRCVAE